MADLLDDVFESADVPTEEIKQEVVEDDIPEKYKGKTAKEIIAMHQEAEKLIGKQGSEVGELRRTVDDFIKTQTLKESKTQEQTVSDDDFFVEPQTAVNRAIDNHPAIKEAKQASLQMKKAETLHKLEQEFPNLMETVNDNAFIDWIKGSQVRTELFARAENQFDYASAKELIETWNERQSRTKEATSATNSDRNKQLKAADVGATGSTENVSKKKYRRTDIIKLMKEDPARYEALAPEIMRAYAEHRVI